MQTNNTKEEYVEIIPLGGVEEIGINCTIVKYKNKILIVDAGLGFSEVEHLGVDYLVPNFEYLEENKHNIEGIFITHGHLDHIGALNVLLPKLDYPDVFAPRFAIEIIKNRLEEAGILSKTKLHEIQPHSRLKSEPFVVEFFRVNHSIPDSMGIIIDTPVGKIVFSGDFKFDNSPLNEPIADYAKMASTGQEGVRLLLSDSTNSFKQGISISELEIKKKLEDVIQKAEGRVIVATFSSLVTRLYAITEIAKKFNRKIFITGRSMDKMIKIARELHYINAKDDLFIGPKNVNKYSPQKTLVLATGSQGEELSALSRMAKGEHRQITLKPTDTIILSSSIIPGNDAHVQQLIDEISQSGAKVYHSAIMNLHTSGHGFIEDQKLMINLFQPKSFIPVHGYQYLLRRHGETAEELGIDKREIVIAKRGNIIQVTKNNIKKSGTIKHEPVLISGLSIGDVGKSILEDRNQLANNGVVIISLLMKQYGKDYRLQGEPHVYTRGFVYEKDNLSFLKDLKNKAHKIATSQKPEVLSDFRSHLRKNIENQLSKYIESKIQRNPLIVVNIEFIVPTKRGMAD